MKRATESFRTLAGGRVAPESAESASAPVRSPSLWVSLAVQRIVLVALLIAVWWLASLRMPGFVLPGPAKVAQTLLKLVQSDMFFSDLGITLYRVLAGFVLSAAVGAPLGIVLGANPRAARFFEPLLSIINTVSSAIWAVFAIIWFGISNSTTVFVVFMTAMPLILTNVWRGALTVERQHIELARSFRMSQAQIMRKIFLPTVLPHFFSGARLAFGFGWRVSLVAETIGSSNGIGYRLRQAADLVQTDQVFAWTVTLVVLMLLIEAGVLKPLERHLFRWKNTV
ncbi:ABC transporter permease [Paraburkholderia sp. ZP32-5]|uniref:ABC transporter permease n=1 Tax=Paraburkholderia sp. ZP32-5 TaxID=2883245 RepID=UPI001F40DA98|nr:ABC transporter permease [Paraburkholderia sp. ZP32-5]